jgi:hypothetical protein
MSRRGAGGNHVPRVPTAPLPPTITIPRVSMDSGPVMYTIVTEVGLKHCEVQRRFSAFTTLHDTLVAAKVDASFTASAVLPGKTLFNGNKWVVWCGVVCVFVCVCGGGGCPSRQR